MPRVVYIDDEPGLLEITKHFLEINSELDVDTEGFPMAALAKIAQGTYDVIVSDYQMPGMDGIELLKALRRSGDRTPFILFTGRGREEVAIDALNNGADFYLQKGGDPKVQFRELKNAIIQLAQRKKAENLVALGERKYRDLVEGANSIILKLDPSGNIIYLNEFGTKFFGAGSDAIGRPVVGTLIMPQDHAEYDVPENFTKFIFTGKFGDSLTFPARSGGIDAWVSWTVRAVRDVHDEVTEYLVIGNDVTALKNVEMQLQHSTAVLRATLDSSDEGILVVANDGNISEYNLKFLSQWKIPAPIMEARSGAKLIDFAKDQLKDPDDFVQYVEDCYASPDTDNDHVLEFTDGRIFEVYSAPEHVGNKIAGRFWSFKDITRQKEFEKGLLQRNENNRSLFVNNPAIMLLIEPDTGRIVHANKTACHFYGYDEGTITNMRLSEISTVPFDEYSNRIRLAKSNQKNYFIAPHRLANNEIKDVEIFLAPINYKGNPLLFSIVQDISGTRSTNRSLKGSELRHDRILDPRDIG
jgi:PAS domain S-box-containing protein